MPACCQVSSAEVKEGLQISDKSSILLEESNSDSRNNRNYLILNKITGLAGSHDSEVMSLYSQTSPAWN